MQAQFAPLEVKSYFEKLAGKLATTPLATEHSGNRIAAPDEFMLMCIDDQRRVQFKHRDTRNYVYLNLATDQLEVPMTNQAFNLGYFDKSPSLTAMQLEVAINEAEQSRLWNAKVKKVFDLARKLIEEQ